MGQPAIAPPVTSLDSLRMISVEHRSHMQKQQQGVVGQQLRWDVIFFFYFFNRGFFSSFSRLYLAYPQRHSFPYCLHPSYLCFFFRLSNSSIKCGNTYLHTCLCAKPLLTKPANQRYMFQIHIAPQPLGTAHYPLLFLVTSFLRNYYGGRGCL